MRKGDVIVSMYDLWWDGSLANDKICLTKRSNSFPIMIGDQFEILLIINNTEVCLELPEDLDKVTVMIRQIGSIITVSGMELKVYFKSLMELRDEKLENILNI